jgi:DHA3 family macrolide efflux protein-like MFS transporter
MAESSAVPPLPLTFREVLRLVVMRRVWYAQLVSVLGDFLALFAVIAVVTYRMHGTAGQVTGVQIAYMLPFAVISPLSGVFVDRWPVKPTLVSSDLIRAGLVGLLFLSTSLWQIDLVFCALGCVSTFFGPAQTVTIRSHVPTHGLIAANALMQIAMRGMRVIGPALASALDSAYGTSVCYAVYAVSFVA